MATLSSDSNVAKPPLFQLTAALLLVYGVWGTTYFGLSIALTSMPPVFMNASRFLAAAVFMLALARAQGQPWPTARQWGHAAVVGTLMIAVAMNLVGWAQHLGIGSGLMATVVATMPLWLTLWQWLGGTAVPAISWLALGLGFAGAALLALEGDFASSWLGALLAFGAPLAWSLGSHLSRQLPQPSGHMAAGAQWLVGGLLSLLASLATEPVAAWAHISATSWLAWAYLLVMGTLVTLNAYLWLLRHASPTLAGSYSFVNPAVALLVGAWLGQERLTGWVFLALPLIALALVLLLSGPALVSWAHRWLDRSSAQAQPLPPFEHACLLVFWFSRRCRGLGHRCRTRHWSGNSRRLFAAVGTRGGAGLGR